MCPTDNPLAMNGSLPVLLHQNSLLYENGQISREEYLSTHNSILYRMGILTEPEDTSALPPSNTGKD